MRGRTAKTPEKVAEAQRMRADDKTLREIGEHFGVSVKTAHAWISDPDGRVLKERKTRYGARCVDCGDPTSGSEGRREQPRCVWCGKLAQIRRGIPGVAHLPKPSLVADAADDALRDLLTEVAPYGLTDDCPARQQRRAA